jgi:hypothetical protein
MYKVIALVVSSVLLAGCASSGNDKVRTETADTVSAKVVKGSTTSSQLKALYGEPSNVSLTDGGNEVWTYTYAHATIKAATLIPVVGLFAGGSDVNKNEVVFLLDKNGVVQNYTVHASQTETRNGGSDVGTK